MKVIMLVLITMSKSHLDLVIKESRKPSGEEKSLQYKAKVPKYPADRVLSRKFDLYP